MIEDITQLNKEHPLKETVCFDEYLNVNGEWVMSCDNSDTYDVCVVINTTFKHNFFVCYNVGDGVNSTRVFRTIKEIKSYA